MLKKHDLSLEGLEIMMLSRERQCCCGAHQECARLANQENRPRYDECIEHLNGMSLRKITKLPNIQPCEIKSLK